MLVQSADDLGRFVRWRRTKLKLTQGKVAGVTGVEPPVVSQIERGRGDTVELLVVRLLVNSLGLDLELRPRDAPFVPVPPTNVSELGLSAGALAALHAAEIREVDLVPSADDLLRHPEFSMGLELYEVACALNRHGMTLPVERHCGSPVERDQEIFRLRVVEGLTLKEIGKR